MGEEAKGGRCAVDEMAPRRDEPRVDTEALTTESQAADLGAAMKAGDIAIAARERKGSTEAVKGGQRVHAASARAGEEKITTGGEGRVAVQAVAGRCLDPM